MSIMMAVNLGENATAKSYETRAKSESTMDAMTAEAGASEVWLRGNPRPAIVGAALVGLLAAAAVAAALAAGSPPWIVWSLAAAGLTTTVLALALVAAASLPRLVHRAGCLRVRLAPLAAEDVPLEIVECVFPGSSPLAASTADTAARRVGTVVVRLAERATAWKRRPTFAGWGTWEDGHIVIDGRWCEPLGMEVTRRLGERIQEAKRRLAAVASPGSGQACR